LEVMTAEDDDGEAIHASLGDPQAFGAVFDRHFDAVHRFLRRRVGADVAQDLAGEAFLRAFEARDRFDRTRAGARPWLLGIAVNLLGHHYRSEERRLRAYARTGVDDVLGEEERTDARLDAAAARRQLAAALADLQPGDRDALLLQAWAELEYAEIAEALEIPLGTVRSRLNRAREEVRRRLAADEVTEWTT
jgi:RNA polymerase sigma factor (sigma-70 family)